MDDTTIPDAHIDAAEARDSLQRIGYLDAIEDAQPVSPEYHYMIGYRGGRLEVSRFGYFPAPTPALEVASCSTERTAGYAGGHSAPATGPPRWGRSGYIYDA